MKTGIQEHQEYIKNQISKGFVGGEIEKGGKGSGRKGYLSMVEKMQEQAERKPYGHIKNIPEDSRVHAQDEHEKEFLKNVKTHDMEGHKIPVNNPEGHDNRDKKTGGMYILHHKQTGKKYLVDPQGFNYPRYVAHLKED